MKFITVSISALFLTALCANAAEQEYNLRPYQGRITNLLSRAPDNFIGLMAYEQNYLMETISNRNYNDTTDMKRDEVKFQISLALPIWREIFGKNSVLAGSYTQRSWFQMTNFEQSSPFRETNYNPRIFLGWATQYNLPFGWTVQDLETGYDHESNGRDNRNDKSRSWNRLYARTSAIKGNWIVEFKPWWRIPESKKDDDNPDIKKYRGYFDLSIGYRENRHQIKVKGHYHPRHNKGGVEVSYSYALNKHISFYTQYYGGYGESLLDYNRNTRRIGLGISLNNVF